MYRRPRVGSIAASIFTLVFGTMLIATIAFVAISFRGPPPRDMPHSAGIVAIMLRDDMPMHRFSPPGMPRPPRTRFTEVPAQPAAPAHMAARPRFAAHVATLLGVPPQDVLAWSAQPPIADDSAFISDFVVAWYHGTTWRVVTTPPSRSARQWRYVTLLATLASIIVLAWPSWALARAISRPIRQMAESASAARAGAPLGAVPSGGVGEVRLLAAAIARMHDRLSRHAEGRTTMLAAIAHDLGTPLSRLAFWIEQLPEEARTRANADLEEMRAMLGSVLRFARDESKPATDARIDLGSLLDSLTEDMSIAGAPVTVEPGPRAVVRGDPQALRRLFANLVENAIRYGQSATLAWSTTGESVEVTIDDHGPGFALDDVERLFEPFVRGDPSRNRETGGTGLGLAIVRSIAEAHRGSVALCNHGCGGRVRVTLPIDNG